MDDVLGDGIFNSDHAAWYKLRKATAHIFTRNLFEGVISDCINEDLSIVQQIFDKRSVDGQSFDLSSIFFAFTLSSFTKICFGADLGCLTPDMDNDTQPPPFAVAFNAAQVTLNRRFVNPWWKFTEMISGTGRRHREAVKIIDDTAYGFVDARLSKDHIDNGKQDVLKLYQGLKDDDGNVLTRKQLRDAVLNLIIAGRFVKFATCCITKS